MAPSGSAPQFDRIWDDPWPSHSGPYANAWHPVWEEGGQAEAATAEPPLTDPAPAAPTPAQAAPGRGGRP